MRVLALTMGEPSGIGPELALAAWQKSRRLPARAFALFADPSLMRNRARMLQLEVPVQECSVEEAPFCFADALPVIPLSGSVADRAGTVLETNAPLVIEAITRAVEAVQDGKARAVITNPIQKASVKSAGFSWPGQTEYLAELYFRKSGERRRPVMMLASDELKVVPLTIHIPLKDVPSAINETLILETAQIITSALRRQFGISSPRLAVAGLNPHAGESGTMGLEETRILAPAITKLRELGVDVHGPYPADTLFHEDARRGYDAVLAMYHDQALIPIKTLAFDSAVNVTLGLSFVRTSPDHGTALDIAGKGMARPGSLLAAIDLASRLSA